MSKEDGDFSRISALHACAVMDTEREAMFDQVVFTIAQFLRVRSAAFVLIDRTALWCKSSVGLTEQCLAPTEMFMRHVVATNSIVVVDDAPNDVRFAKNMTVRDPEFRFCVAAPLYGPGQQVIGCLCAFDRRSRRISDYQLAIVQQLARQGSELLQLRVRDLDLSLTSYGASLSSAVA